MRHALSIREIMKLLPHRYPFLLIDRVIDMEFEKSITAIKNVSMNEAFFVGHFPNRPVMPGVMILEAMAQAGAVLAYKSTNTSPQDGTLFYFAGIDDARFKRIIYPGDQIRIVVRVLRMRKDVWKLEGEAFVDEELACKATFMSARKIEKDD